MEADVDEIRKVCAEAYQVVGSLLVDLGQFNTDRATKILDNLNEQRLVHGDVLPWPSFTPPREGELSPIELKEFAIWAMSYVEKHGTPPTAFDVWKEMRPRFGATEMVAITSSWGR